MCWKFGIDVIPNVGFYRYIALTVYVYNIKSYLFSRNITVQIKTALLWHIESSKQIFLMLWCRFLQTHTNVFVHEHTYIYIWICTCQPKVTTFHCHYQRKCRFPFHRIWAETQHSLLSVSPLVWLPAPPPFSSSTME